ncbi:MAG TPA: UMP kinase, partial [Patescibacteria group bacterium]|nr:UMP kinase [Patescibacteria group bacterium]
GWRPGWSTDYVAVRLADNYGIKRIVNLSNIDYVYDSDPRKNSRAKRFTEINWKAFRKLVGSKWDPGANVPFDPVAAKWGEKMGAEIAILNGKNIANVRKCIREELFKGTTIR